MIRVNVLYPAREGGRFDFDYYLKHHIPMVEERLTPLGLTAMTVDKGVGGLSSDLPPAYTCVGSLMFKSAADLKTALATHGLEIMADIPNYTDSQPVIQVSEVLI